MTLSANHIQHQGRQYHLGCKPGDIANKIILVGDPGRATQIAQRFSDIRITQKHREFFTYTGTYKNQEMTVMSTGMGEGNMEISIIEISQIVKNPTIIRCGSCSALQPEIELGTLVISNQAVDLGAVCAYYNINIEQLHACPRLVSGLELACRSNKISAITGKTASAPGFYGPQGRHIEGFPIKRPHLIADLQSQGIQNLEMEIATLLGMSSLQKISAGAVCAVYGNRARDTFLSEKDMLQAEHDCIEVSLLALHQIVV